MGYSDEGEMGWRMYIPELKEMIVGVNCIFNEVIPAYREEYFQELSKMRFEMAKDESTVETFEHFVGVRYTDDETLLEYETTRVALYKGLIVAYRAPMNSKGKVGFEEKSPIHIADVVRMYEMSTARLNDEEPEHSAELVLRSILKSAGPEATMASIVGPKRKVRFDLQAPGHDGQDGPRGVATGSERLTHPMPASTMRSAHDTEQLKDAVSPVKAPRRPAEAEHDGARDSSQT